jgi:hypothetical protein
MAYRYLVARSAPSGITGLEPAPNRRTTLKVVGGQRIRLARVEDRQGGLLVVGTDLAERLGGD